MTADDPDDFQLPTVQILASVLIGTRQVHFQQTILMPPPGYRNYSTIQARAVVDQLLTELHPAILAELVLELAGGPENQPSGQFQGS